MKTLVAGNTLSQIRSLAWPIIQKSLSDKAVIKWSMGTPCLPSHVIDGDREYLFISYEQGRECFMGYLFDSILLVELPPEDIGNEIRMRLAKRVV